MYASSKLKESIILNIFNSSKGAIITIPYLIKELSRHGIETQPSELQKILIKYIDFGLLEREGFGFVAA